MDFLDKLVHAQSAEHMVLLRYLLALTYLLVLPYMSVLFGATLYSLIYSRKGRKTGEKKYLKFAKELADIITVNKSIPFALGIIPFLSIVFDYAQLLHLTDLNVPEYVFFALILFVIALVFIYTYKYSAHLRDIFSYVSGKAGSGEGSEIEELENYNKSANQLYSKSGLYGFLFLVLSSFILIGSMQLAADTTRWSADVTIFSVIFSLSSITYYLNFIASALAVTSAFILYIYFRPNNERKEKDQEYLAFVKKFALNTGLVFSAAIPVLTALNIFTLPGNSITYGFFGVTLVLLVLLLIICNLFYRMIKESKIEFSAPLFYFFILVFIFAIIKDHTAFDTATKAQFVKLTDNYAQFEDDFKKQMGVETVAAVSGADIYNGKCIACHAFDHRVVGPAYDDVLGKYVNDHAALVQFISHPVKKNPNLPTMPNQGLKPNEVEAIANYIIERYKKETGKK